MIQEYTKIFLFIFSLSFIYCKINGDMNRGFELYFIKGSKNENLNAVVLPKTPLISDIDIISYNWKNHSIKLTEKAWAKVKKNITKKAMGEYGKLQFVVTVNRKPKYIGYFWTVGYAVKPETPVIFIEDLNKNNFYIKDIFMKINNDDVYRVLKKAGKIIN